MFEKKETNEEIKNRLLKLTNNKDYGIFPPAMNAQIALNELCRYFLGEDWFSTLSMHNEQINTEIVYKIECKLKKYKAIMEKNKQLKNGEEKLIPNAYHSPSPMNELCDYICTWEKKHILWEHDIHSLDHIKNLILNYI